MKKSMGIILTITMLTALVGCTESRVQENMTAEISPSASQSSPESALEKPDKNNQSASQKSDQISSQEHASTASPSQNIEALILSEDEKETLRKKAIDFSIHFPYTFGTPTEIDTNDVGWYTFWQLFNKDATKELQNGYYLISDDSVNQYVNSHFGIERLIWNEDIPKYDEGEGFYYFYPVGEQPLFEGEISEEEFQDNETLVTFKIVLYRSAMEAKNPQREQIATIDYMFTVLSANGENEVGLQIVSAIS